MLPRSLEELNKIREECRAMVKKRAAASGMAVLVPIPGTDIAADIGMLMKLIPAINERFGLSREQIEQLEDGTKILVMEIVKKVGGQLVARVITRDLIVEVLKKVAGRFVAKQFLKFVPVAGQLAAAGISFAAMKYLGDAHIDECYQVALRLLEKRQQVTAEAAATAIDVEYAVCEELSEGKQDIIDTLKRLKELLDAGIISESEFQGKKQELLARL